MIPDIRILELFTLTPGPRGKIGLPIMLWGDPGTTKTASVELVAKMHGLHLETIILSQREAAEVAGFFIPPRAPGGSVEHAPPDWAIRLVEAERGILFLDELPCAPESVQAPALDFMVSRRVGALELPPEIRIIAAGNPPAMNSGGGYLTPAMANRLGHLDWPGPDAASWAAGLEQGFIEPTPEPATWDEGAWKREWAFARSAIAQFARAHPAALRETGRDEVPLTEEQLSRAWGSLRTWEMAARALAGARTLALGDAIARRAVATMVGEGLAGELWAYLNGLDLPDPERVLLGNERIPTDRPERAWASLSAVVQYALSRGDEEQTRALEIAAEVAGSWADVAASVVPPICARFGAISETPKLAKRLEKALMSGPLAQLADLIPVRS